MSDELDGYDADKSVDDVVREAQEKLQARVRELREMSHGPDAPEWSDAGDDVTFELRRTHP